MLTGRYIFTVYMSTSPSDLLDQCNAAITACLTAQVYSVSGRTKQMALLEQLRAFRKDLIDEINCSGPMFQLAIQVPLSFV